MRLNTRMNDLLTHLNETLENKHLLTVKKNPLWVEFLSNEYPFAGIKEACYLYVRGLHTRPICAVDQCQNYVNWIGNNRYSETCGYTCANKLKIQTGKIVNIRKKMAESLLKNHGCATAAHIPGIQDKRKKTMIERYGALVSDKARDATRSRTQNLNFKGRQTIKAKYGVDNVGQLPEVKDKVRQTLIDRYGAPNTSASPKFQERLYRRRYDQWQALCDITIMNISRLEELSHIPNQNCRITFSCNKCGEVQRHPTETIKFRQRRFGSPCTLCCEFKPGQTTSAAETEIFNLISSFGVRCEQGNRKIIYPKELDIWLPDLNIAIEYCGLYWHSEQKILDSDYHLSKLNSCQELGIRLITIFEDEWINKRDIVISRLKYIVKRQTEMLYARKCKVLEISNSIANQFCNANHLQGPGRINTALGLFHNETLISVMTFANPNIAKGGKKTHGVELNRFCSLLNTTVVGGANKLFAHYCNVYNPSMVFTYSDRRWNTGEIYSKLGFEFEYFTRPNYWYISGVKRLHRFGLRKNKDDDQSLTEWQNRQAQGWNRIWDCGNAKYIWSNDNAV